MRPKHPKLAESALQLREVWLRRPNGATAAVHLTRITVSHTHAPTEARNCGSMAQVASGASLHRMTSQHSTLAGHATTKLGRRRAGQESGQTDMSYKLDYCENTGTCFLLSFGTSRASGLELPGRTVSDTLGFQPSVQKSFRQLASCRLDLLRSHISLFRCLLATSRPPDLLTS